MNNVPYNPTLFKAPSGYLKYASSSKATNKAHQAHNTKGSSDFGNAQNAQEPHVRQDLSGMVQNSCVWQLGAMWAVIKTHKRDMNHEILRNS